MLAVFLVLDLVGIVLVGVVGGSAAAWHGAAFPEALFIGATVSVIAFLLVWRAWRREGRA